MVTDLTRLANPVAGYIIYTNLTDAWVVCSECALHVSAFSFRRLSLKRLRAAIDGPLSMCASRARTASWEMSASASTSCCRGIDTAP